MRLAHNQARASRRAKCAAPSPRGQEVLQVLLDESLGDIEEEVGLAAAHRLLRRRRHLIRKGSHGGSAGRCTGWQAGRGGQAHEGVIAVKPRRLRADERGVVAVLHRAVVDGDTKEIVPAEFGREQGPP